MIRSLYYQPKAPLRTDLPPEEYPHAIQNRNSVLWVDFSGESPQVCEPILRLFGFHPLSIDDALQETHSPKLDDWSKYLYIVLNYMQLKGADNSDWETDVDEKMKYSTIPPLGLSNGSSTSNVSC